MTGDSTRESRWRDPRLLGGVAIGLVVALSAALALLLQRNGHTQGDDFALYLRQARSIFDGDTAQVVADNRFSVVFSGGSFSPIAYPWGLPLLLSPFVRVWGLDYDRLKLVIVASFCVWVFLVYGVVRRRIGRVPAVLIALTVGTVPMLLAHADSLLSEFPQAAAVAVLIGWLDRVRTRSDLISASTRDLVIVGLLVAVAFNIRRESLVLVFAIGLVQLGELIGRERRDGWRGPRRWPWPELLTPHVAFAAIVVGFQLLLPSMLLPDNADSGPKHIGDRLSEWPAQLTDQLGLYPHHAIGLVVLGLAFVGIGVGIRRRPGLDGPLAAIAVCSVLAVSTHFRFVGRYYFQVLPWVLYFGTVAVMEAVSIVVRWWRSPWRNRLVVAVGVVPLLVLIGVHANKLPSRVSAARDFNAAGRQQVGPTHEDYVPVYAAVAAETGPDDVIWFFRARTMTLLTDRRSIQTSNLDRGEQMADYVALNRRSDFYEPTIDDAAATARGWVKVWEDDNWTLWELHPAG